MYVFKKRIFIFYLAIFLGVLSILIRLSYVQIFWELPIMIEH